MDLSIVLEGQKLNIRATAVIIHDNKLLVHKNANEDFCALVGGRVQIGESSEETIKREIFEEMGKKVEILEYLTTIENFFDDVVVPYHEIMFMYRVEFTDEEDKKILTPIKNIEGNEELTYNWIDIDKLEEIKLNPYPIRKMIKDNVFPAHKVYDERGKK